MTFDLLEWSAAAVCLGWACGGTGSLGTSAEHTCSPACSCPTGRPWVAARDLHLGVGTVVPPSAWVEGLRVTVRVGYT